MNFPEASREGLPSNAEIHAHLKQSFEAILAKPQDTFRFISLTVGFCPNPENEIDENNPIEMMLLAGGGADDLCEGTSRMMDVLIKRDPSIIIKMLMIVMSKMTEENANRITSQADPSMRDPKSTSGKIDELVAAMLGTLKKETKH